MAINRKIQENSKPAADESRLAAECSKLNPDEEQDMAELGLARDMFEWPEYD
jgi:hypothetical protein